jgi:hypothetical protein
MARRGEIGRCLIEEGREERDKGFCRRGLVSRVTVKKRRPTAWLIVLLVERRGLMKREGYVSLFGRAGPCC